MAYLSLGTWCSRGSLSDWYMQWFEIDVTDISSSLLEKYSSLLNL